MVARLQSPEAAAGWLQQKGCGRLQTDSRMVRTGDAFIAWPGHVSDGRKFVPAALAAGAAACLVEAEGLEEFGFPSSQVASLVGLKAQAGRVASAYYEMPSKALAVLAVTGTNGKTSCAWWLAQGLALLGQRCGVIGTLGIGEPPSPDQPARIEETGLTTPDPVKLQSALRSMAGQGFKACAIEASSIGLIEQRLAGLSVRVALFTNFSQDHLDYHQGMEAYWSAKRQLFDFDGLQAAVINLDDAKGAELAVELAGRLELWTYGLEAPARLNAHSLHYRAGGMVFTLQEQGALPVLIESGLIGEFNVANLLAVIGGLRALGHALASIVAVIGQVTPVPGRMQRVGNGQDLPQVVVDYAHTPDALEKALNALKPLTAARGGDLHCLFGCGGNRDQSKRPLMGAIAVRLADRVTITSDNPRHEDPAAIIASIVAGLPAAARPLIEPDRRAAILQAVLGADRRDVLLLAGKGHEEYQESAGLRRHFSDLEEARQALLSRAGL